MKHIDLIIEETLENETKVFVQKTHWSFIFNIKMIYNSILILFINYFKIPIINQIKKLYLMTNNEMALLNIVLDGLFYILIVFLLFELLYNLVTLISIKTILTTQNIIQVDGIFSVNVNKIPLSNIENIDLKQSPIGLLLNYGTIKIKGQGFSTFYFENIINPINFKNEINIIMEKNK